MNIKKGICLSLICMLSIGFIFFNSSQTSVVSNERSLKIAEKIIEISEKNQTLNTILHEAVLNIAIIEKFNTTGFVDTTGMLNLIIRKCAHAFEFFILSLILCLTFETFGILLRHIAVYSLFVVLLSASFDEFYQLFILGRTSSVIDILIDFAGGILGVIVFGIIRSIINRTCNKN